MCIRGALHDLVYIQIASISHKLIYASQVPQLIEIWIEALGLFELRSQISNSSIRINFEDDGSALLQKVLEESLYNEAKLLIKEMQPFVLESFPASNDFLDRNVLSHIKN